MSDPLACLWCGLSFEPRRGGSQQKYCRPGCRAAYHKAARLWCERAIAAEHLTVQDLRDGAPTAYTLPKCTERQLPLSDMGAGDTAPGDALLRFIVDIERSKVDWLIRFRLLPPDHQGNLLAIMNGLKCLGLPPSISRIC